MTGAVCASIELLEESARASEIPISIGSKSAPARSSRSERSVMGKLLSGSTVLEQPCV
jgi:hypothetical protein